MENNADKKPKKTKPKALPMAQQVIQQLTRKASEVQKVANRLENWLTREKDNDDLGDVAAAAKSAITSLRKGHEALAEMVKDGWSPRPAPSAVAAGAFEKGVQVAIKKEQIKTYALVYTNEDLNKLVVEKVVEGKPFVIVEGGDKQLGFVPKAHLQARR